MTIEILQAIGGLGLFLVGMTMLTDGLRTLAGDRLRHILRQSTDSPVKGAVAGALTTAMVQSSSATTVAAVGFVAAGLMTFQQSLGIIFGANIGTTLTGWLVAILGFKLDLGAVLMPLVLAGVLTRMFGRDPWTGIGWALAGFGILFIGIEALKDGMVAFRDVITPDRFPADTGLGRLQLILLGMVVTVITQSSGAGVASTLAALSVGAISFPQAAALVIGMDVGTTSTALMATIGGTTAARRTGAAHVVYNLLTAGLAFALLYPLGWLLASPLMAGRPFDPQIALVAFHSGFNLIGVIAVLGVTPQFARLVMRLIPDSGADLTGRLDPGLMTDPKAALDAANATVHHIAQDLFGAVQARLTGAEERLDLSQIDRLRGAIDETRSYLQTIRPQTGSQAQDRQVHLLHALDHLNRQRYRLTQSARVDAIRQVAALRDRSADLSGLLTVPLAPGALPELTDRADLTRQALRDFRETFRDDQIRKVVAGQVSPDDVTLLMDTARWMQRSAYHVWRILVHLHQADAATGPGPGAPPPRRR